jgi:filamentous hemagglutinin family protein
MQKLSSIQQFGYAAAPVGSSLGSEGMTTGRGIAMRRLGVAMLMMLTAAGARAEVVIHGGQILSGPAIEVPAAVGESRGANLFHSFQVFNVLGGRGESVTFTGPEGVKNVISRVTGGTSEITGLKSSLIDGPLAVAIPGANFYFINPYGVVFGESGSIQADGSVHISTADNVKLQDGGIFHADPTKTSTLTSAPPSAFGFLGPRPAPIEVNGPWIGDTLPPVPPGKTFALVGGDIEIRGGRVDWIPEIGIRGLIVAPGATVTLASVASAGDVGLLEDGKVDVGSLDRFPVLGRVEISGSSIIDVGDSGAGSIQIRAGELSLSAGWLFAQTLADDDGGMVDIGVRGNLTAITDPETGVPSLILAGSYFGFGAGPSVRLDVGGTLEISDGSFVVSESLGPGRAGDIDIQAGTLRVRGLGLGEFTGIGADTFADSTGPSIRIAAPTVEVLTGGYVGTRSFGPATGGSLSIEAGRVLLTGTGDITLSLSTETVGGNAGDLTLTARTLELRDGARISSSTGFTPDYPTGGYGDAGAMNITASEQITINGDLSGIFSATSAKNAVVDGGQAGNAGTASISTPVLQVNGGVIDSTTVGDGDAGSIFVQVGELQLTNGGQIRSFSGGLDEFTGRLDFGNGAAGTVSIDAAGSVSVSGISATGRSSGVLAQTRGPGAGGDVQVTAPTIALSDGAIIGADTGADGDAGRVVVRANALNLSGGARIGSDSGLNIGELELVGAGASGTVAIDAAGGQVSLTGSGTTISTSTRGSGSGGNVGINAAQLALDSGATIAASTTGAGAAGQIDITATEALRLKGIGTGVSTATEGAGAGGSLTVQAPSMSLEEGAAIFADTTGDGDAGGVRINVWDAGSLSLRSGARISSQSGRESGAVGAGSGGTVTIEAARGTVSIAGFGTTISTNTRGSGSGGNVSLDTRRMTLQDGASISSSSLGSGLAGDVAIALGDSLTMRGASIETEAVTSDGGNIAISLPGLMDLIDSRITTSVQSGEGGGGNITIARPEFVVLQRSQIIANAFGGPGGNIDIAAGQLITDPTSVIEASSALGIDGNVNIDAPNPDVGSNLVVLPESFLDVAGLLQPTCGAARAGLSSLVQVGRGGLPADPDGYLPSTGVSAVPVPAAGRGSAQRGQPDDGIVLANLSCSR